MKPGNTFYQYTIKYILQEILLKETLFIILNNLDIYRCTLEVKQIQLRFFFFFFMYLQDKAFKYLKNQNYFRKFQVMFHKYLDIRRDDDNDYDDRESSFEDWFE